MRYGEAFRKLGYTLGRPRLDWSAASPDGICLSLWRSQIDYRGPHLVMDSRRSGDRLAVWTAKAGNRLRRLHVVQALEHHAGWIDAVIVDGAPTTGVTDATPWNAADRQGLRWRVTYFDDESGHIRVEALPAER